MEEPVLWRSMWSTLSHDIVVGEQSTTIGEFIDVRGVHLWVVVAYITPTLVIGEDNDYIGLAPKDLSINQERRK